MIRPGDRVRIRRGMWAGERVTVDAIGPNGVRVELPKRLWSPGVNWAPQPVTVAWYSPTWLEPD